MLRSTSSTCCKATCRAFQASRAMSSRRSASKSSSSKTTDVDESKTLSKQTTATGELQSTKQASRNETLQAHAGRLSQSRKLAQIRAASLYHQSIDFPNFELQEIPEPPQNDGTKSGLTFKNSLPAVPVPLQHYIAGKIVQPLTPRDVTASTTRQVRKLAPQHDQHAYMNERMERSVFSLAPPESSSRDSSKTAKKPKEIPWTAVGPDAPRESKTRAKKMVDALLGTVDAKYPGPDMVRDICQVNERLEAERQSRN